MAYKVVYFDEVKQDVKEAKQWYQKQSPGLEKRFAKAIKECIAQIIQNPYVHAIRYRKVRIAHPAVFPYAVHYYIDEAQLLLAITAIVHNSRNPLFPQGRM